MTRVFDKPGQWSSFYPTRLCEWWLSTYGWSRSWIHVCGCRKFSLGWCWSLWCWTYCVSTSWVLPSGHLDLSQHSSPACVDHRHTDSSSRATVDHLRHGSPAVSCHPPSPQGAVVKRRSADFRDMWVVVELLYEETVLVFFQALEITDTLNYVASNH